MPEAAGERESLIGAPAGQPGSVMGAVAPLPDDKERRKVGPMEISRSTRYGILAGIWTATFLSVCTLSSSGSTHVLSPYFDFPCVVLE